MLKLGKHILVLNIVKKVDKVLVKLGLLRDGTSPILSYYISKGQ